MAHSDLEHLLKLDPNNTAAQKDIVSLKHKLGLIPQKKTRMEIEEFNTGLPITYYGPSTSSLRVEPHSMTYYSLCGTTDPRRPVPCKCNGAFRKRHPMCRICGEKEMKLLLQKAAKPGTSPNTEWTASKIYNLCLRNNTNFFVIPSKSVCKDAKLRKEITGTTLPSDYNQATSRPILKAKNISDNQEAAQLIESPKTSFRFPTDTGLEKKVDSHLVREFKTPTGNGICDVHDSQTNNCSVNAANRNDILLKDHNKSPKIIKVTEQGIAGKNGTSKQNLLASQAAVRGDTCFSTGEYKTALAYYTTSLRLHSDPKTILSRATTYMKLERFQEAVDDCTQVIEREPENTKALMCRATAYSAFGKSAQSKLGMLDVERVMALGSADGFKDELNNLMTLLLKRVQRLNDGDAPAYITNGSTGEKESSNRRKNKKKKKRTEKSVAAPGLVNGLEKEKLSVEDDKQNPRAEILKSSVYGSTISNGVRTDGCVQNGKNQYKTSLQSSADILPECSISINNKDSNKNRDNNLSPASKNSNNVQNLPKGKSAIKIQSNLETSAGSDGVKNSSKGNKGTQSNLPLTNGHKKCSEVTVPRTKVPSSFQFQSRWEAARKRDSSLAERESILSSVPPDVLPSVVGEKLDADMANEIIKCVEAMSKKEPELSASYLRQLPMLQRFSLVKLLLDDKDILRIKNLLNILKTSGVELSEEVKSALV